MAPTMWHSGKGKTVETGKIINGFWGLGRWETSNWVEHRGFRGQWEYCVCYQNDRYMSFNICQTHRMYNTKSELCCKLWILSDITHIGVDLLTVKNVPLWSMKLIVGEAVWVWKQGVYGSSVFPALFCWENVKALKK